MSAPTPILASVNDACKMLCVSRPTLYKLIRSGDIKAVKLFNRTLLPVAELRSYADTLEDFILTDPAKNF